MNNKINTKGFDSAIFAFHLLIVLTSYSIYLAPYIAPSTFPYLGFIPIFYPVIFLANLLLVIILFIKKKRAKWLFLVLLLGLFPPLTKSYEFLGKKVDTKPDFKIITYNVMQMNNDGFNDFFLKENADVVVVQEGTLRKWILKKLKSSAFEGYYSETTMKSQIFSKYPIIEFKPIFQNANSSSVSAVYADLDTGKDTIRIINVHLESMGVDKKIVMNPTSEISQFKEDSNVIKNRMITGFLKHQQQLEKILPYIQNSPYPVILAGDFNSVPNSYEYRQITYWLKDTYREVGRTTGTSFHGYKYPIRIDYIFHSDDFLPVSYKVRTDLKFSDHYPIIAEFKLPETR